VGKTEDSYAAFLKSAGLGAQGSFTPGPVTPLLAKSGAIAPALQGQLLDGVDGVIGRLEYCGEGGLSSSGMLINDQPRMKLVIDLDVPGQEPRRVTRNVIVSDFAAYRMKPGLVLPVCVNPSDPEDVLIVW